MVLHMEDYSISHSVVTVINITVPPSLTSTVQCGIVVSPWQMGLYVQLHYICQMNRDNVLKQLCSL